MGSPLSLETKTQTTTTALALTVSSVAGVSACASTRAYACAHACVSDVCVLACLRARTRACISAHACVSVCTATLRASFLTRRDKAVRCMELAIGAAVLGGIMSNCVCMQRVGLRMVCHASRAGCCVPPGRAFLSQHARNGNNDSVIRRARARKSRAPRLAEYVMRLWCSPRCTQQDTFRVRPSRKHRY